MTEYTPTTEQPPDPPNTHSPEHCWICKIKAMPIEELRARMLEAREKRND